MFTCSARLENDPELNLDLSSDLRTCSPGFTLACWEMPQAQSHKRLTAHDTSSCTGQNGPSTTVTLIDTPGSSDTEGEYGVLGVLPVSM